MSYAGHSLLFSLLSSSFYFCYQQIFSTHCILLFIYSNHFSLLCLFLTFLSLNVFISHLTSFYTRICWWSFTGVRATAKSFQVSRTLLSILTDLNNAVIWMASVYPPIPYSSVPFPRLWGPFQEDHLQLVSPSPSCSTVLLIYSVLWQGPNISLSFNFLLFSLCATPKSSRWLFPPL